MVRGKKAWIRIIESFSAIVILIGVILILFEGGYIKTKDLSSEIYSFEDSILTSIQTDESFRSSVLSLQENSSYWEDEDFPSDIKEFIENSTLTYLECEANICEISSECNILETSSSDIYVQSILISANLTNYNPKQIKLFCWEID